MKKVLVRFLFAAMAFINLHPECGAQTPLQQCSPAKTGIIQAENRCVESGGIHIDYAGDEGMKVACMKDKIVQGQCGPDGSITRLHAYLAWMTQLKQFEDSCAAVGGTFAFQDPRFIEPQDESYCLQADPEVRSDMFENQLCNFHSVCPSVPVVCNSPCKSTDPMAENSVGEADAAALAVLRSH